ncbi:MAG: hypothetical protein NT141_02680 [candidate division WWE3 bacterium]|nr:hypothetical protein [candidate division WWE3 bacterium]
MLDTVKLMLDKTMFEVDSRYFYKERENATRGYCTYVQNPVKSEQLEGVCKPRLSLTNRFNCTGKQGLTLSIEFSAPKLIFNGNNFDELQNSDFPKVFDVLQRMLLEMGVRILPTALTAAPVSAIHYSKNIPLTDGTTPHYIISKIEQANVSLAIGTNRGNYLNGGFCYKQHTNLYEYAFYDKLKELQDAKVSEKDTEEKGYASQLGLFNDLRGPKEVLRMEIRLNSKAMIQKTLSAVGVSNDLTFGSLFKQEISQKVLLSVLQKIEDQRPKAIDSTATTKEYLANLQLAYPKSNPKYLLSKLGLKNALSDIPTRELRAMFPSYDQRNWYGLMAEAKKLPLVKGRDPFVTVRSHLVEFKPLKLVDFQDSLIKNDKYGK